MSGQDTGIVSCPYIIILFPLQIFTTFHLDSLRCVLYDEYRSITLTKQWNNTLPSTVPIGKEKESEHRKTEASEEETFIAYHIYCT